MSKKQIMVYLEAEVTNIESTMKVIKKIKNTDLEWIVQCLLERREWDANKNLILNYRLRNYEVIAVIKYIKKVYNL